MKWVGCNTPTRDMTACCLNFSNCAQTSVLFKESQNHASALTMCSLMISNHSKKIVQFHWKVVMR